MKIFSLVPSSLSTVWQMIYRVFFENMPPGVTQTFDPTEADAFFVTHGLGGLYFDYREAKRYLKPQQLDTENKETIFTELVGDKPVIMFFDAFGVSRGSHYPPFLREMDIPVSVVEMPPHPNAYVVLPMDAQSFFEIPSIPRLPNSAIAIWDQLIDGYAEVMATLITEGVLSHLTITKATALQGNLQEALGEYVKSGQVQLCDYAYPYGVRMGLNQHEYVLSTRTDVGMEYLCLQGGHCGSKPIYPDTDYYRDMLKDVTGISYFDVDKPLPSLRRIFCETTDWHKHKHTLLKVCDPITNMAKFWQHVKKVVRFPEHIDWASRFNIALAETVRESKHQDFGEVRKPHQQENSPHLDSKPNETKEKNRPLSRFPNLDSNPNEVKEKTMICIEIGTGANPYWGLEKLNAGKTVYFVEPQPQAYLEMQKYIETFNSNSDTNLEQIKCVNVAISDRDSLVDFESGYSLCTIKGARTAETSVHHHVALPDSFTVGSVSLSTFLAYVSAAHDAPIESVYIDTEGSEMLILAAWDFKVKPQELIIEVHHPDNQARLIDMLAPHYDYVRTELNPSDPENKAKTEHLYFQCL